MTDDEIRIAIAESVGWKNIEMCSCKCCMRGHDPEFIRDDSFRHLPDYPNDLNAMHEVEKTLLWVPDDEHCQAAEYYEHLVFVCGNGDKAHPDVYEWHLIRATARQRCEAYLRTIGKWID